MNVFDFTHYPLPVMYILTLVIGLCVLSLVSWKFLVLISNYLLPIKCISEQKKSQSIS